MFPLTGGVCLDSLTVVYKDKVLNGIIKKKEEAKEEYDQAIKDKKVAAYAQKSEEFTDIMIVKIGNIEPMSVVDIKLIYIE